MTFLRVAQINLHHAWDPTAILKRHLDISTMKIVLIQEPYYYDNSFGELDNTDGNLFYKSDTLRPRACIFCSKDLDATKLEQFCSRDVVTILLRYQIDKIVKNVILCSSYLPYDSVNPPPSEEMANVVRYSKTSNIPIIIGCDANSHHIIWGSSDTNSRGESLLEYICSANLEILNSGKEPTFITSNREEVLDITVCSMTFSENISNWHVFKEDSLSDHQMIIFDLSCDFEPPVEYRCPKATDLDLFNAYLEAGIANLDLDPTDTESLDISADSFSKVINFAFNRACPLKIVKTGSKTIWWNSFLEKQKRKNNWAWNNRKYDGHFVEQNRQYKKHIRNASRNSFQFISTTVNSYPATARLNKLISISKKTQLNNLILPNGDFISDEKEILIHLLNTHFPDCHIPSTNPRIFENVNFDEGILDEILDKEHMKWAIFSFKPYKSAGPDNIFPKLLQSSFDTIFEKLKILFKASLCLNHIPKAWQSVRVVFIPKPGKPSYDNPKSFRPISLTSFLLKTLERLIGNYIEQNSLVQNPLHSRQHSYQRGKSTESALHEVVFRIEKAFANNEVCLAAFLDVEGFLIIPPIMSWKVQPESMEFRIRLLLGLTVFWYKGNCVLL